VVINNFNITGIAASPHKAHAPLVTDADAVLALAVTLQSLKPIVWRYAQVVQACGAMQHLQLSLGNRPDVGKPRNRYASKQGFGIGALETLNHGSIV